MNMKNYNAMGRLARFALAAAAAPLLFSCTTTMMTVSPKAYQDALAAADKSLEAMGYQKAGEGVDTRNELVVTANAWSDVSGYSNKMENVSTDIDRLIYRDAQANTVEIEVRHMRGFDWKRNPFLSSIAVSHCETPSNADFKKVCDAGGAMDAVRKIEPDQESKFLERMRTVWAITGASALFVLLVTAASM